MLIWQNLPFGAESELKKVPVNHLLPFLELLVSSLQSLNGALFQSKFFDVLQMPDVDPSSLGPLSVARLGFFGSTSFPAGLVSKLKMKTPYMYCPPFTVQRTVCTSRKFLGSLISVGYFLPLSFEPRVSANGLLSSTQPLRNTYL